MFRGSLSVFTSNGTSIRAAVLAQLQLVTDGQTDHAARANSRIYALLASMQLKSQAVDRAEMTAERPAASLTMVVAIQLIYSNVV